VTAKSDIAIIFRCMCQGRGALPSDCPSDCQRVGCPVFGGSGMVRSSDAETKLHSRDNPDRWQRRAEEMRSIADGTSGSDLRRTLLKLAGDYDGMEKRGEQRSKASPA
jgi:hypothetical protein